MLKTILGIGVILGISAFFVATQPITPQMALVSSISVLIFAFPSYWAVSRANGKQRGAILLLTIGTYALVVESLAIHTGIPYGNFVYTDLLGTKVFGLTPWTVAFAYPPILFLGYWLARQYVYRTRYIIALTAAIAMCIDLVLDPAAVKLGFWYWLKPGFFYGVPLVNFAGWLVSGAIGALIVHLLWRKSVKLPAALCYSGLAILWFWTMVNLFLGQYIPFLVGVFLTGVFIRQLLLAKARI